MKVLAHELGCWFFLEDDGEYYLDANCSHGAFGFSFCMQLDESEVHYYQTIGLSYIQSLGKAVLQNARYNSPRNIKEKTKSDEIHQAIMGFNQSIY